MTKNTSLSLVQTIIDTQKELVVLYEGEKPALTNRAFNDFCGVSSLQEYRNNFGEIEDRFVPHPSYFHKNKIEDDSKWFDAIMQLDEKERVVSMLTSSFEPCAFSVNVDGSTADYKVVTFTDITRDLIQRIMKENNDNLDKQSGAYSKKYFMHVTNTYEEAAIFNDKIIGTILVTIDDEQDIDEIKLKEFVEYFKDSIRQDDMFIRWSNKEFLLVYLMDNEENAKRMLNKLLSLIKSDNIKDMKCKLNSVVQKDKERINSLVKRVRIEE